jgi:hypothetical protein
MEIVRVSGTIVLLPAVTLTYHIMCSPSVHGRPRHPWSCQCCLMDWPEVGNGNCKGIWHNIVVACGRTDVPYHVFTVVWWNSKRLQKLQQAIAGNQYPHLINIARITTYTRHVEKTTEFGNLRLSQALSLHVCR